VSSDVVEGLDFYPGNFGVAHGRALGGTVEVRTRDPKREWHGATQLDVFDGRVEVEGPIGNGSAFASIRRSWIDAVLAATLPTIAPEAANNLRVAPRYYDYQTKLSLPLYGGEASFFAFGSDDKTEFVQDDPSRRSSRTRSDARRSSSAGTHARPPWTRGSLRASTPSTCAIRCCSPTRLMRGASRSSRR
jgi:hypothetical protein